MSQFLVAVFFNLNYFTQTQLSNNLFAFIKNIMFVKQNIDLTQMYSQVFFKWYILINIAKTGSIMQHNVNVET